MITKRPRSVEGPHQATLRAGVGNKKGKAHTELGGDGVGEIPHGVELPLPREVAVPRRGWSQ